MKALPAIITAFFLFIYSDSPANSWDENILNTSFKTLDGKKVKLTELVKSNAVFIMLSPECPLCQNYTLTIKKLMKAFPDYTWLAVFPGKYYSKKEIKAFFNEYQISIKAIIDSKYILSKSFKASITPEAFLVNPKGNIIYKGAIDNWAPELGKKRDIITEHFLRDALRQTRDGEMVNIPETEAVGCKIQY